MNRRPDGRGELSDEKDQTTCEQEEVLSAIVAWRYIAIDVIPQAPAPGGPFDPGPSRFVPPSRR